MKTQEDTIDKVKSGSEKVLKDIAEEVSASAQEVKEQINNYSEKFIASIQSSPLTAVGIAMGVGVLLGALVKRK